MKQKETEAVPNTLIETLGVHLEKEEQLAPVAARIMSTLMLTGKEGITFEQLVNNLEASKSTVCTNLNLLESMKRVSYFTKPGDRKRYFSLAPDYFSQRINEMIACWEKEKQFHEQLICYKEEQNQLREKDQLNSFDLSFHNNALFFLTASINAFQKLKDNLIQQTV
jgi:DNA-binding transcriptional regulator GbsR (MarR family)